MTSFEQRSIEDRIVLLTGASRGIGHNLAVKLAKSKANLILTSTSKDIEKVAEEISKETGNKNIKGFECNQSDLKSVDKFFEIISKEYSHIDILINNASIMIGYGMDPLQISDELELLQLRTNIDGYFFMTKRALPLLFKSPSGFERTIIFTSSDSSYLTNPVDGFGALGYKTSKTAENGLMVALHQLYVGNSQIAKDIRKDSYLNRVVCVDPGFVATGLGKELMKDQTVEEIVKFKNSIGGISVDEGSDSLFYCATAKDGVVESGKLYHKRKVVSF